MSDHHVNENSDVYYQGVYWNDLELVRHHINARVSGDPSRTWSDQFAARTGRTFARALILNCGNGWVERDLLNAGLFAEGVGIDYSDQLLAEARTSAENLALRYEQCDINSAPLPVGPFDLVVNHAAAHHIAKIDRVFRDICRLLPEDGWFVSFDYVGPHRNQYTAAAWEEVWAVNQGLPATLRQDLNYPHLPTMLALDPTEAIHSELILETFQRYFTLEEWAPVGGAIAYPLLTHNRRFFDGSDVAERSRWVEWILEADDRFLQAHPGSSLFAYFAGRPNKSVLDQTEKLSAWESEEAERERRAQEAGGEYYPRTALSTALIELDLARRENEDATSRLHAVQSEITTLRSSLLYSTIARVFDAKTTRRLRSLPTLRAIENKARRALGRAGR